MGFCLFLFTSVNSFNFPLQSFSLFIFIFIAFCVFLCVFLVLVLVWSLSLLVSTSVSLPRSLFYFPVQPFDVCLPSHSCIFFFFLTVILGPSLKFFCVVACFLLCVSLFISLQLFFMTPPTLGECWYVYMIFLFMIVFSPFIDLSSHFCLCFGNDPSVRSPIRIPFSGHTIEIF